MKLKLNLEWTCVVIRKWRQRHLYTNSQATSHNKTTRWCEIASQKAVSVEIEWQSMRVQNTNEDTMGECDLEPENQTKLWC